MCAMNPRLLRPLASGFNPRSIVGLELWLDASDASTLTLAGSSISEIRDKSGNGWAAVQAVGANQPTYNATAINGRGAAVFNGTSSRLTISSFSAIGEFTAFAVCYRTWATSGYRAVATQSYTSTSGAAYFLRTGGLFQDWQINDLALVGDGFNAPRAPRSIGPLSLSSSEPAVFSGKLSASESTLRVNGVNTGTRVNLTGTPAIASGTLFVGSATAADYWDGGISQLLIYNAALSVSQIQAVESWLGSRYSITVQ